MRLANKVAVITGASSGIGRASAILFAKEGAKVVAADIDDNGGNNTIEDIKSSGGEAIFVHTDVAIESDAENLVNVTMSKFGKVNILLNIAATVHPMTLAENIDASIWDRVYAVNVKGTFFTVKYVVPVMKETGEGVIINIGSAGAIKVGPQGLGYRSSKGAVNTLTRCLAIELAPYKIRVNVINPGPTDTVFLDKSFSDDEREEGKKKMASTLPLGRLLKPEEIAHGALYLASDEAAMVTGIALNIDGGRAL